jgi:hypothetical protein
LLRSEFGPVVVEQTVHRAAKEDRREEIVTEYSTPDGVVESPG